MSMTLIEALVKIALMLGGLMGAAAYFVLVERRVAAWIQDRQGPNRVGIPLTKIRIWGLGQPMADGLKFIFKEEFTPKHVDWGLYWLAPIVMITAAIAAFAVIPFGSVLPEDLGIEIKGVSRPIELVIAPGIDVGMIYVFAMSGIAVYGVLLGGWSSNNKYSFLGGLRSAAQLISYELPLGLGILGVVLASGSLRLDTIIHAQAESGVWFAFAQPLGFSVFIVAAFAEAGRLPFDLPECEQELVGGYHTEYSGMKLMLFLVAEFLHMIAASVLLVVLFLGGWHFWGLTGSGDEVTWIGAILRVAVLFAKVLGMILFFMLVRWTWPRFRYDQLMALGWKVMLPLGLVHLVTVAMIEEARRAEVFGDLLRSHLGPWTGAVLILAAWAVAVAAWLSVALAGAVVADNRPRREMRRCEIDPQIKPEP